MICGVFCFAAVKLTIKVICQGAPMGSQAQDADYITYLPFYQDKALALDAARGALNEAVIK